MHGGADADPATTLGNHSERSAAALGVGNRWLAIAFDNAEVFAKRALASLGEGGVHGQIKFGIQAAVSAAVVN